jgi:NTE family protein
MRALVISGGGSKGAFAGGIAQYLIQEAHQEYDFFLGSSTGSLLISHLALGELDYIQSVFTSVTQAQIFSNCPFTIRYKNNLPNIGINHFNVLKNFIRGRKTFGESHALRKLVAQTLSPTQFEVLQKKQPQILVTVSNLTTNKVEYKAAADCSYEDFIDWIWISCNYIPFMSLVQKDRAEYADGGLGCIVPISKAFELGATHVDSIMLNTAVPQINRMPTRNAFDALAVLFNFMVDQIGEHDVALGKMTAKAYDGSLRVFHTPRVLTTNSLVFDRQKMQKWWAEGHAYAHRVISEGL